MQTQSNIHFYVNWAKERLDEMEAVLTLLEGKVGEVQADARDKANKALADLRKSRDIFRDTFNAGRPENRSTMTPYQKLARSPSVTPRASNGPIIPSFLPR